MITLWGRTNSINVQKVLWVLDHLKVPYERIDAGLQFGVNNSPEFLAMNPNGKIPLINDGGAFVWESHAICKYVCNVTPGQTLYPTDPAPRGQVDQWLDWALGTLYVPMGIVFLQLVRTPEAQRNPARIEEESKKTVDAFRVLNQHMAGRQFVVGSAITLADIVLSAATYRCAGLGVIQLDGPDCSAIQPWFAHMKEQPEFKRWVEIPLT
jgi:glutathione S-transferase